MYACIVLIQRGSRFLATLLMLVMRMTGTMFKRGYIFCCVYLWIIFTSSDTSAQDCVADNADVVFAVDDSSSVQRKYFNVIIDFVKGIVLGLTVGPDSNHVSFISFSSTVKNQFYLDDYTTQDSVLKKIDSISYRGGGTNIERALIQARDKNFNVANGAREDVAQILVLITDGTSTVDEAVPQSIRDAGIKIMCVGISDADGAQLQMIAGDTGHVQITQTVGELSLILSETRSVACQATKPSACAGAPCRNGGTCTDSADGGYTCSCPLPFTGPTCETATMPSACAGAPCRNGGTCTDSADGGYTCSCPPPFTGPTCETVDICGSWPCLNDATCVPDGSSYSCICAVGFTGDVCQTEIVDICASRPCLNGGTCVSDGSSKSCTCAVGFIGDVCQTESVDICASRPCLNGATCVSDGSSYNCTCSVGFTGDVCEIELVDICDSRPCLNGATCVSDASSYSCTCAVGFTGDVCETEAGDVCHSLHCLNGATCVPDGSSYKCTCIDGFTGDICQTEIGDTCESRPCLNGGTCVQDERSYSCACAVGFSGYVCQTASTADECEVGPCKNGGTCIDLIGRFYCDCPAGFTGMTCETASGERVSPLGIGVVIGLGSLCLILAAGIAIYIIVRKRRTKDESGPGIEQPDEPSVKAKFSDEFDDGGVAVTIGKDKRLQEPLMNKRSERRGNDVD